MLRKYAHVFIGILLFSFLILGVPRDVYSSNPSLLDWLAIHEKYINYSGEVEVVNDGVAELLRDYFSDTISHITGVDHAEINAILSENVDWHKVAECYREILKLKLTK